MIRDFRWNTEHIRNNVITLKKHEIENYLLDPEAIYRSDFNHNSKLSQAEIEGRIESFILANKFWFACCYLLADLDLLLRQGFPAIPNTSLIVDGDSIVRYLTDNGFIENLALKLQNLEHNQIETYVQDKLEEVEKVYQAGNQYDLFPGKEALNNIRSFLHGSSLLASQATIIDLAKDIADKQIESNRVPKELQQIRDIILS